MTGVAAIAAGWYHTVALKNDGTVVAWRRNDLGQVTGTDEWSNSAVASPVPWAGQVLTEMTSIAAGNLGTVALRDEGSVVTWRGTTGQVPEGLTGVIAIAEGGRHAVALVGSEPAMPSLNSRASGNELILSWPTSLVGFRLQSTLSLTPPVTWIDSTQSPAVIGAQFTVTNVMTGSVQFYRLRKP